MTFCSSGHPGRVPAPRTLPPACEWAGGPSPELEAEGAALGGVAASLPCPAGAPASPPTAVLLSAPLLPRAAGSHVSLLFPSAQSTEMFLEAQV